MPEDKEIEDLAFAVSPDIRELNIDDGTYYVGKEAFRGCLNLEKLSLGDDVREIDNYAFADCVNLKELHLNSGLRTILNGAFANTGIEGTITIPGSVSVFGSHVFDNCDCVSEVTFEDGSLYALFPNSLAGCSAERIVLSKSISEIPFRCFAGCYRLKEIEINTDSIAVFEACAFDGCRALEKIRIPPTLIIPTACFQDCENLEKVVLESCREICSGAFRNCRSLSELVLPPNLEHIHSNAFENCESLYCIQFESDCIVDDNAFSRRLFNIPKRVDSSTGYIFKRRSKNYDYLL